MSHIRPTTKIGVPPGTRFLRLERANDHWIVWINANIDFTLGTYLRLYNSGKVERVTVRIDEGDDIQLIKP